VRGARNRREVVDLLTRMALLPPCPVVDATWARVPHDLTAYALGSSSTFPVVRRSARSICAWRASESG
jgi:hypothetical protein